MVSERREVPGDGAGGPTEAELDGVLGVRAGVPYGPRWAEHAALVNKAVVRHGRNGGKRAVPLLERALRATEVPDVDGEGLDLRARVLGNLAALAEGRGEVAEALRLADEALAAGEAAERLLGDTRSTSAVLVSVLINRAQTLQVPGRFEDALADCDRAATLSTGPYTGHAALLGFHLHNTRGCVLIGLERYAEAEAEIQRALALALEREPRLAGHAYTNLGLLAQRSGDAAGTLARLRQAGEFHELAGDPSALALLEENLARVALEGRRLGEAERRFQQARRAYSGLGAEHQAAGARFGEALVAFLRGRPLRARKILREAAPPLERVGEVSALVECELLAGDIAACALRFKLAEDHYLAARAHCVAAGRLHDTARIDVRRARVVIETLRFAVRRKERERRLGAALNLALPAALATDAMRHGFPPGPTRERWSREVTGPAVTVTLRILTLLQQPRLAMELVENLAASSTLVLDRAPRPLADDVRGLLTDSSPGAIVPEPFPVPAEAGVGAFAASMVWTGSQGGSDAFPAPRFALPPRLRIFDAEETELDHWIEAGEERYGRRIRSDDRLPVW
ncbi:tetratricopeptide repeat protein [Streptomyces profundus]|uniref:tetratricopeptide repeat protein n=1 Tax=Streptomyces profundus TaxID=2867410 RepID=UPI001D160950|nr:tetratricopeptide repeat protein [Streptomyces sp. MA3_2.13]UED87346.1 tetratricopeptide repeat protein [Streptomyces sp. MA3_2.13]